VFYGKGSPEPTVGDFQPRMPMVINGISYSGRALDMLGEFKRVSFSDVENTLEFGERHNLGNVAIYDMKGQSRGNGIRLVVDSTGTVIQVLDLGL